MNKGRRKRIAANILDEYNNPSSSTSERTYAEFTTRKPRSKVPCYCSNCNGKMIDPRTKERHEQTNSLEPLNSDKAPTSQELVELIDSTISLEEPQDMIISLVEPQDMTIPLVEPQDTTISIDTYGGTLRHITEVEQVAESTEYDTDDIYTISNDESNLSLSETSLSEISTEEINEIDEKNSQRSSKKRKISKS
ncbi:11894_t:CDS:2, partial [Rhizophagus irregularis]